MGFSEFANKLSLAQSTELAAEIGAQPDGVGLLKKWMLSPGNEDWLLVLDNFDDIEVKLDRFFPIGASGSVLITTRDRHVIGSIATSGFHLTAMDLLDAERLFLRIQNLGADTCLEESASGSDENQILKQILEELQCFPLAIDQAASFIRENSPMTLREYQTYLKPRSEDRERLLRFKQANPTYPESVMTTWEISLQSLERNHPRASRILQLLGFLDHSYISEELLTTVTKKLPWIYNTDLDGKQLRSNYQTDVAFLKDDVEFRVAIGTLVSLSLIRRDVARATLHVHPLVHEWIRVRLNPEPKKQAEFTIVGALLLYQYMPSERLLWLGRRSKSNFLELQRRIDQLSHHIGAVRTNLADYGMHSTTISLECYVLCEVYFLAGFSRHTDLPFGVSAVLSTDLGHLIKMIIGQIPPDQRSFAHFIHKVILWLEGDRNPSKQMASVSRIADSLDSLQAKNLREECPDDFFMLLAYSVVGVCAILETPFSERIVFDNDHSLKRIEDRKEQRRSTTYRLLDSLRSLLSSIKPLSVLLRRTRLAVIIRLVTIMTPEEYAAQTWLDIEENLSSKEIGHLDYDEKAVLLSHIAHLLWEHQGPRDFLGLQRVFAAVIRECSALREYERRSAVSQRDRAFIHAASNSRYISSSFGRELKPKRTYEEHTDMIIPLDFVWNITPQLAERTSDPKQQWRLSSIEDSRVESLDLSRRRWSLKLISSISKIYKRYCAERDLTREIDVRFLGHFEELSVRYLLINIYAILEDWRKLQHELVVILQCDEVLRFCNRLKVLPWEPRHVADVQGDRSSPLPSHAPQQDSQQSSWLILATRPFKMAKDLVTSQFSQTGGAPILSADTALVTKLQEAETQNAAAEIEARLEVAAAQCQLRALSSNLEDPLPRAADWERDNRRSKLRRLDIPDPCDCIADRNVGKATAHFFTLAQKLQLLNEKEASDLRLKIKVVAKMPSESFAKYLGNLEVIYLLARKLSARFPDSMYIEYNSDDDDDVFDHDFGKPSPRVRSDYETDDEVNYNVDSGNSYEMTGLDWGW